MKTEYFWVVQTLQNGEWIDIRVCTELNQGEALARRDIGNVKRPGQYRVMWRRVTTEDITEIK